MASWRKRFAAKRDVQAEHCLRLELGKGALVEHAPGAADLAARQALFCRLKDGLLLLQLLSHLRRCLRIDQQALARRCRTVILLLYQRADALVLSQLE